VVCLVARFLVRSPYCETMSRVFVGPSLVASWCRRQVGGRSLVGARLPIWCVSTVPNRLSDAITAASKGARWHDGNKAGVTGCVGSRSFRAQSEPAPRGQEPSERRSCRCGANGVACCVWTSAGVAGGLECGAGGVVCGWLLSKSPLSRESDYGGSAVRLDGSRSDRQCVSGKWTPLQPPIIVRAGVLAVALVERLARARARRYQALERRRRRSCRSSRSDGWEVGGNGSVRLVGAPHAASSSPPISSGSWGL
jgi:hypothetical protein